LTNSPDRLLEELTRRGLLLVQDKSLPNVVSIVTGEIVRGSWWGHPRSHEIFQRLTKLGEHADVLFCKLISGKVTLIHRRLWPALLAVATSREPWQTAGLAPEARRLIKRVEKEGSVVASGKPVRELERRLLVYASEEHTETGAHRMVVETWPRWAERVGLTGEASLSAAEGKRRLEEAAEALGARDSALPWSGRKAISE
jgi:hypothetical protein